MAGSPLEVLVVGGGVAGLASALAMARNGHRVTVLERDGARARSQSRGGWHLWGNAVRALQALDVADRVAAIGAPLERTEYLSASGRPLASWAIGDIGRSLGASDLGVSREALHAVLATALTEAAGAGSLRRDSRVVGVRQAADAVEVEVDGAGVVRADVLIGADGIGSVVREAVCPEVRPRSAGYTQWQALVPEPGPLGRWLPAGVERVVFGRRSRAVLHHVGGGLVFWAGILYGPAGRHSRAFADGSLLRAMTAFPPPVADLVRATAPGDANGHDILDLRPLSRWASGRVVLVGDAAHAMTTNLSQGACLALEDAVVLADCLSADPGGDAAGVSAALGRYQQRRMGRAQAMARRSRRVAAMGGWRLGAACVVRDQLMRMTLPTVALRDHERFVAAAL